MSSNFGTNRRRGERTGAGPHERQAAKAGDRERADVHIAHERAAPSPEGSALAASAMTHGSVEPVAAGTPTGGSACMGGSAGMGASACMGGACYGGTPAMAACGGNFAGTASSVGSPCAAGADSMDMDVTVLAFAQWVSELKSRQNHVQNQLRSEMSMIRQSTSANQTDLSDFRRHGAAIQQQMQGEINDIREQLSGVFMEITSAVRNNSSADQEIKLKIQALNEQAVRNETAFAQLADAADQSQSRLRSAVTEMQLSSERLRDELGSLVRQTDSLETSAGERGERMCSELDTLSHDIHAQLERRREHLRKMVNDVVTVGESLQSLVAEFAELRKGSGEAQSKIQNSLAAVGQTMQQAAPQVRRETHGHQAAAGARPLAATVDLVAPPAGPRYAAAMPPYSMVGTASAPAMAAGGYGHMSRPSLNGVMYR